MSITAVPRHYLLASDFDQTLSFNESGEVLSELIGASSFRQKVEGLAASNLVQQGGELFLRSQRALASSAPPRPSADGPRRDLEVALALIRRATRTVSEQSPGVHVPGR